MTLAELQAQREQLLAMLSAPESVQFQDRALRYRSADQIREAIAAIGAEIAAAESTEQPRLFMIQSSRGLE